ncbi:hypothetical protein BDW02DRAFT_513683, partial [Decorospora gaudefroyi]
LNLPKVSIIVCTNLQLLYDYLVKLSTTKKKRLIIDIIAIRKAYKCSKLIDI